MPKTATKILYHRVGGHCVSDKNNELFRTLYYFFIALFFMTLLSCGDGVIQRVDRKNYLPPPPPKKGFLHLPQAPAQTQIFLDNRYIGRYQDYPKSTILLSEGKHQLRLVARGYAVVYAEVVIRSDKPVRIKGKLLRSPSTF